MKICSIASGSSGNCIYVGDGTTHILIDAGISRKRIVEGLSSIGVSPDELSAIFVTHEHSDHIQGLKMMVKMFDTPIYATRGTLGAIRHKITDECLNLDNLHQVEPDNSIKLGNMTVTPFSTSHDASDPACYTIETAGHKASIATDLGKYDDYIIDHLQGSELIMLEANHDISMLESGAYPYQLKCRILGEKGHLSNDATGKLICSLLPGNLKYIFLSHLSKENNYPELAYQTVKCCLWENMGISNLPFKMYVAKREQPSEMITL